MVNVEALVDRFLRYVRIHTTSDDASSSFPSTSRQLDFGKLLAAELKAMGLSEVEQDEYGYVYATVPANVTKTVPTVGFLAHLDTAPAESGDGVKPQILRNYPGGDIKLAAGPVIRPSECPVLDTLVGNDLITTDGTTLLGADDKAGIAEIMTAIETLLAHPEIPRGKVRIAFTPDEEIGMGVAHFDVKKFGADFGYTLDGGELGELEDETFCADGAEVIFRGINYHPGMAKGRMVNSQRMAALFISQLDERTLPETTEGREDYYHVTSIKGTEAETRLTMIIRSFTEAGLADREKSLENIVAAVRAAFPRGEVELKINEQYRNMKVVLDQHPKVLELAEDAMRELGIDIKRKSIRGGTDGSRLAFMGLPTPNVFAGGINMHAKTELVSIQTMARAVEVIVKIISRNAA